MTVSVSVTNTGKVAGKEIVQVYVHDRQSRLARPPKELKGFAKLALQPGETRTVNIPLDFRAFAYYHPAYKQWITDDGEFDILIGASAADIRCSATVTLRSTAKLPCLLNCESTIRDWMEDPRGRAVFEQMFQQLKSQMLAMFGGGDAEGASIGMDTMGFIMEMPLLAVLHFQDSALPVSPEEMVDGLLKQVHGGAE
jgi:beta-glucosidase